ncbi:VOC family protein [Polynucleobacter sp. 30F-ANTBAC]|uniref:VOC family protein n=1 Tax=Polynucleobacter sp. 30F-ANTBAC TaxID=2689095 RepID=UPI001C0E35F6|nr:VOC family protein [Polynucleobacter sp. 30F-ANTBAC]MBU3600413.1 VOC family protein [Polynucleobacter sp. 30F-ANTBAC]
MNICQLGYVVVEHQELTQWADYAENVLGMAVNQPNNDTLHVKMDERPYRFLIVKGNSNCYQASGWELPGKEDFDAALAELDHLKIKYTHGDQALADSRMVQQLIYLSDPSGNRHELFWGHKSDFLRFISPVGVSKFLTESSGMGHTVLPAPKFEETLDFVTKVLGFGISDIFNFRPDPAAPAIPIYFFHCKNSRHHSLALAAFDVLSKCVHVMVEVESMVEVGYAMDRMKKYDTKLSATLGQHTNDRMISFYMKTPTGFDIEYGYGGLELDWKDHSVHEFTTVSLWGHDFSVGR